VKSTNREYLASVDHIRAFAALLVVTYHGAQLFSSSLRNPPGFQWLYSTNPALTVIFEGHTGVALFMVLSGFIFTVGTLGHGVSWTRFMANRLLRIYPLFLLLAFVGLAAQLDSFSPSGFLLLLTGLAKLPGATDLGPVSAMFWAVGIEMQFYLIFPLLNRILSRFGLAVFARLLLAIIVVRGLVWVVTTGTHDATSMLYYNIAGRIDQFLLGMIAAWFFVNKRRWFKGWWKVGLVLAVAVAGLWEFNQAHAFAINASFRLGVVDVEGAIWALAILTYVSTLRADNIVTKAVAKVGETSYSIYLLHIMVLTTIINRGWFIIVGGLDPVSNALLTTVAVLIPMVLVISVVTYYGVEQPFLRLRVRYLLPDAAAVGPEPEAVPPVVPIPPAEVVVDATENGRHRVSEESPVPPQRGG
jgi:peptidoglycan/LPS O-acetylase OafA/YrhL